jgi:membrane-associated phospholipid phosphatase
MLRTPPFTAVMLAASLAMGAAAPLGAQAARRPLFVPQDAAIIGAFALGTLAAIPFDRRAAERLQHKGTQENRFLGRTAVLVRSIAEPGSLIIGATLYGVGRVANNDRMAALGLHGTEAIAVGLGTATVIKGIAGRARPYATADTNPRDFRALQGFAKEDFRSFPSGHTVMAFAAASTVTATVAQWWPHSNLYVAPAMYGGAALVGLSRMYNNKHWATDVVAGAAIGTFSGLKVARYHRVRPGNRIDRWLISGSVGAGGVSVGMVPML